MTDLPRLLLVSPIPPSWSGVATYSNQLISHLKKHWKVTVMVSNGEAGGDIDGVEVIHVASNRWYRQMSPPDRVLHCLGNSDFHLHVPDLVREYGGVVLAHDVRMNALHCFRGCVSNNPHYLSDLVRCRHGDGLANEIRRFEDDGGIKRHFHAARARLDEANAYLLGAAVNGAGALLVHSEFARRLASFEVDEATEIGIASFGYPERAGHTNRSSKYTVASFGFVAPEKQPDLLIDGFALWASRSPTIKSQLRFVGYVDDGFRAELQARAGRRGIRSEVVFVGRTSEQQYAEELATADLAVQLRLRVNGEASAAIADCLSSGLPTIVSDAGAQAELPGEAVLKVPPSCDAVHLANQISLALEAPKEARALTLAAKHFAENHSFERAVESLTEVLLKHPIRGSDG